MSLCANETRAYTRHPTWEDMDKILNRQETKYTLRLGLFRFVTPSNASPSSEAICAPPMSTLYPSPIFWMITPTTDSWAAGTYWKSHSEAGEKGKSFLLLNYLTRRELLSIHHLLRFAEWCSSPARVAITVSSVLLAVTAENCCKPGPSLRLTCWAGTWSPGKTIDIAVFCWDAAD